MGDRINRSRRRAHRPGLEALEPRDVPATFGVPWADPGHLTLSFVPDGTTLAGSASTLSRTLSTSQDGPESWQRTILRAFQTWAVHANVNIGLVADGGQALGTAGPTQGDARFGDVRVGAVKMAPSALSISLPNDPALPGTLSGDLLFNSNTDFGTVDLQAVTLHEAGHILGLDHSADPNSPLSPQYSGATRLTVGDIASLQALYGVRAADANEGSNGNNSIYRATTVVPPSNWTGATPLVEFGDITTSRDVDVFAVRALDSSSSPMTIRLQSSGISLLSPRLTVLDGQGRVLASGQATSGFGDVVTLRLDRTTPGATYYIQVQGATSDVFGIGRYGVAVGFDSRNVVPTATLSDVLQGSNESLTPNDLAALLLNPGGSLVQDDHGADDSAATALVLASQPGYASNSYYEVVGSLAAATDVDYLRVRAGDWSSSNTPLVLTVTARAQGDNGTTPRVSLVGRDGNVIPSRILAHGNGMFAIQATGLKSGSRYYLRVASDPSTGGPVTGNYAISAQFGTAVASYDSVATIPRLDAQTTAASSLYVAQPQFLNLVFSAQSMAAAAGSLGLVVRDSKGKVVYSLTATSGDTVSGAPLFLAPGAYTVSFTAAGSAMAGSVALKGVSEPIGPVLLDPTLTPLYGSPTTPGWYTYPDGTTTPSDYLLTPILTA